MGSGKSTVGRHLAQILGYVFIDADAEIETRAGADIPWIFDVEGEEGFRRRETAVLEDLARRSQAVIATGGGAILAPANRDLMARSGVVVFLNVPVAQQLKHAKKYFLWRTSYPFGEDHDQRERLPAWEAHAFLYP